MRGLFDEIYRENYKYINALDTLYFLVSEDNYPVSKIAKFFLINDFHKCVKTYKKNYLDQMEQVDFNQEALSHNSYWRITNEILNNALDNFVYSNDINIQPYKESDYEDYFWLKEDVFNFEGFKKIGVKVDNDEYEKYLGYKKINENEKALYRLEMMKQPIEIIKNYEKNLESYWNLRVLPKIFENLDEQITLFDILGIAVRHYTVSYQFLKVFFHKFIYCPSGNCLDETQNGILMNLIEGYLEPSDDKLYKPIFFNDFLENNFPYNLVYWNVDDLALFFVQQDKEIYEYESTFPRFYRGVNNSDLCLSDDTELKEENKRLKLEILEKDQRIKDLELLSSRKDTDLLGLIFNETAQDRYAPDLVYAIKAWESIYIKHPKTDSHNNKANTWIAKNTPYSGEQEETATRRLREIIAPLSEWRHTRKKLN